MSDGAGSAAANDREERSTCAPRGRAARGQQSVPRERGRARGSPPAGQGALRPGRHRSVPGRPAASRSGRWAERACAAPLPFPGPLCETCPVGPGNALELSLASEEGHEDGRNARAGRRTSPRPRRRGAWVDGRAIARLMGLVPAAAAPVTRGRACRGPVAECWRGRTVPSAPWRWGRARRSSRLIGRMESPCRSCWRSIKAAGRSAPTAS